MDAERKWQMVLERLKQQGVISAAVVIGDETRVYFNGKWMSGAAALGMAIYSFDDLFPENE